MHRCISNNIESLAHLSVHPRQCSLCLLDSNKELVGATKSWLQPYHNLNVQQDSCPAYEWQLLGCRPGVNQAAGPTHTTPQRLKTSQRVAFEMQQAAA
jgi:hypothetical protein